jgi:surface antigen
MKYTPRLTAPSSSDKNWIHYTAGGYNYCIKIYGDSCLPNCVGYAWGRWRELLNKKHNLSCRNAELWYENTADGYKRGQTPKLGAVICWEGKGDLAGHVAIVEKVYADGSILTSNSGYKSTYFYTSTIKPPYNIGSNYKFQGFIYNPNDYEENTMKYKIGEVVEINGVYVSSMSTEKLTPRITKGTITRIIEDARNPYLLDNGNIGWVNDDCIIEEKPTDYKKLYEEEVEKNKKLQEKIDKAIKDLS